MPRMTATPNNADRLHAFRMSSVTQTNRMTSSSSVCVNTTPSRSTAADRTATSLRQDNDYMSSLLHVQEESLRQMERKIVEMHHMIIDKRAAVMEREKELYSRLLPTSESGSTTSDRSLECLNGKTVDQLITAHDRNRKLKSEIASLITQINSLGYEGPLGHTNNMMSGNYASLSFAQNPPFNHSISSPSNIRRRSSTMDPVAPKLPPKPDPEKIQDAKGYGLIYSRVPLTIGMRSSSARHVTTSSTSSLSQQQQNLRSTQRSSETSSPSPDPLSPPPALPATPSPAAIKRAMSKD